MATDRERRSEYEQNEQDHDDEIEVVHEASGEEADEDVEEPEFEQPFCPRCGWHNTRPSHTSNVIDTVVRMFGLRPYRCRSCGNRFRCIRRVRKA